MAETLDSAVAPDSTVVINTSVDSLTALDIKTAAGVSVFKVDTDTPSVVATSNVSLDDDKSAIFGAGNDLSILHDTTGTDFNSIVSTVNLVIDNTGVTHDTIMRLGTDTATTSFAVQNNSEEVLFRVSGDGSFSLGVPGASVITALKTMTVANSGGAYTVAQSGAAGSFAITLPIPAAGLNYKFMLIQTDTGGGVSIVTNGGSNHFFGNIVNDVTSVLSISTQDTITFVNNASAIGDTIEVTGISPTQWMVRAVSSVNGGITASAT
jgi:hypothetical protein